MSAAEPTALPCMVARPPESTLRDDADFLRGRGERQVEAKDVMMGSPRNNEDENGPGSQMEKPENMSEEKASEHEYDLKLIRTHLAAIGPASDVRQERDAILPPLGVGSGAPELEPQALIWHLDFYQRAKWQASCPVALLKAGIQCHVPTPAAVAVI